MQSATITLIISRALRRHSRPHFSPPAISVFLARLRALRRTPLDKGGEHLYFYHFAFDAAASYGRHFHIICLYLRHDEEESGFEPFIYSHSFASRAAECTEIAAL